MKRSLISLLVLLLAFGPVSARERSLDEIKAQAGSVLKKLPRAKRIQAEQVEELKVFEQKSQLVHLGYASGGHVVISRDDRYTPVLFYGDSAFDPENVSPAFEYIMKRYNEKMERGEELKPMFADLIEADSRTGLRKAASAGQYGSPVIGPLIATTWSQREPYNLQTPKLGNQTSLTGCGATALAQILTYWGRQGYITGTKGGTKSYTDASGDLRGTFSYDFTNSTVCSNWNTTLNVYPYSSSGTTAQKNAIADLMHACGVLVNMDYETTASGSAIVDVPRGLDRYFEGIHGDYIYSVNGNPDASGRAYELQRMKDELDKSRPILYGGYQPESSVGHIFVVDGYSTNGYVHINLGWNGGNDGYYLTTEMNGYDDDPQFVAIMPEATAIAEDANYYATMNTSVYYKFKNTNNNNYYLTVNNSGGVRCFDGGMNSAQDWWKLILVPGTTNHYYIKSCWNYKYLQSTATRNQAVTLGDTPVEFVFYKDLSGYANTNGLYAIASVDQTLRFRTTLDNSNTTTGVSFDQKTAYQTAGQVYARSATPSTEQNNSIVFHTDAYWVAQTSSNAPAGFVEDQAGELGAQFDTSKFFRLKSHGNNAYCMSDVDNFVQGVADSETDLTQYWKLESTNVANRYYVKNVATNKYLQSTRSNGANVTTGSTPVMFIIHENESTSQCYAFVSEDNLVKNFSASQTYGVNGTTGQLHAANAQTNQNNSYWEFVAYDAIPEEARTSTFYYNVTVRTQNGTDNFGGAPSNGGVRFNNQNYLDGASFHTTTQLTSEQLTAIALNFYDTPTVNLSEPDANQAVTITVTYPYNPEKAIYNGNRAQHNIPERGKVYTVINDIQGVAYYMGGMNDYSTSCTLWNDKNTAVKYFIDGDNTNGYKLRQANNPNTAFKGSNYWTNVFKFNSACASGGITITRADNQENVAGDINNLSVNGSYRYAEPYKCTGSNRGNLYMSRYSTDFVFIQDSTKTVYYINVTGGAQGGGVNINNQGAAVGNYYVAGIDFNPESFKAVPVDDYLATVSVDGCDVTVSYEENVGDRTYTISCENPAGGLVYNEVEKKNGDVIVSPTSLKAANLTAIEIDGYVAHIVVGELVNNEAVIVVTYEEPDRYPIMDGLEDATYNRNDRFLRNVILTENGNKQSLNVENNNGSPSGVAKVYQYLSPTQTFSATAGSTVTPGFNMKTNAMFAAVWLDVNNNGQFDNGERMCVSGQLNGLNGETSLSGFTLNVGPGTYRMRYIVAWDTESSEGYTDIVQNGGSITDVDLVVQEAQVHTYTVSTTQDGGGVVYNAHNYTNGQEIEANVELSASDVQPIAVQGYNGVVTLNGTTFTVTYTVAPVAPATVITSTESAGTPVPKGNVVSIFGGTGQHFAFAPVSTNDAHKFKWMGGTSALSGTTLTKGQLFDLETSGSKYKLKRVSDGKYLNASCGFDNSGVDLSVDPTNDNVDQGSTLWPVDYFVRFNKSNTEHLNINSGSFGGGTDGWATYAVFGPFYVVTINYVDAHDNVLRAQEEKIVTAGSISAPAIDGFTCTNPTYNVSADGTINFVYESDNTEVTVTYNYQINGQTVKSEQHTVTSGTALPATTTAKPYKATWTEPTGNATTDGQQVNIPVTLNDYPFEFVGDVANVAKWYNLKIHRSPVKYAKYDGTNPYGTTTTAPAGSDDYAFAFVGNPFDGYKIVNKTATTANAFGNVTADGVMTSVAYANGGLYVLGAHNTEGQFVLRNSAGANAYINDYQNTRLGIWNNSASLGDTGSAFTFEEVNAPEPETYPICFDKNQACTRNDRYISALKLTPSGGIEQVQSVTTGSGRMAYQEFLGENNGFTVTAGATCSVRFAFTGGWTHGFVYVDVNNNGAYDYEANPSELVSKSATSGSPNLTQTSSFNTFTAPSQPGLYRMRWKTDWVSLDPAGNQGDEPHAITSNNHIIANGGQIIDTWLHVVEAQPNTYTVSTTQDGGGIIYNGTSYTNNAEIQTLAELKVQDVKAIPLTDKIGTVTLAGTTFTVTYQDTDYPVNHSPLRSTEIYTSGAGWYLWQFDAANGGTTPAVNGNYMHPYETSPVWNNNVAGFAPLTRYDVAPTSSNWAQYLVYLNPTEQISKGTKGTLQSSNGMYMASDNNLLGSYLRTAETLTFGFASVGTEQQQRQVYIRTGADGSNLAAMQTGGVAAFGATGTSANLAFFHVAKIDPATYGIQPWAVTITAPDQTGNLRDDTRVTYSGTGNHGFSQVYTGGTFFLETGVTPTDADFSLPAKDGYSTTVTIDAVNHTVTVAYEQDVQYTYTVSTTQDGGGVVYNEQNYTNGQQIVTGQELTAQSVTPIYVNGKVGTVTLADDVFTVTYVNATILDGLQTTFTDPATGDVYEITGEPLQPNANHEFDNVEYFAVLGVGVNNHKFIGEGLRSNADSPYPFKYTSDNGQFVVSKFDNSIHIGNAWTNNEIIEWQGGSSYGRLKALNPSSSYTEGNEVAGFELSKAVRLESHNRSGYYWQYTGTGSGYYRNNANGVYTVFYVYKMTKVEASVLGDVDGDGKITIYDVAVIADMVAGNVTVTLHGDANGDGEVTAADVDYAKGVLLGANSAKMGVVK